MRGSNTVVQLSLVIASLKVGRAAPLLGHNTNGQMDSVCISNSNFATGYCRCSLLTVGEENVIFQAADTNCYKPIYIFHIMIIIGSANELPWPTGGATGPSLSGICAAISCLWLDCKASNTLSQCNLIFYLWENLHASKHVLYFISFAHHFISRLSPSLHQTISSQYSNIWLPGRTSLVLITST